MSHKHNQLIVRILLFAAGIIGAGSLSATPIIHINFLATPTTSTESTGVSGRLTISFSEDAGGDYLALTIANTTPISIGGNLTAVGLEMPDEVTSLPVFAAGGTSAYFTRLNYNVGVNPGWMNAPDGYDLMITSDGKFEGGSATGAPATGEEQTVLLSLGATPYSPEEWGNIFNEFYTQTADHYAIARFQAGGISGEDSDKVLGVHSPEPTSCFLLAAALCLTRRLRRPSAWSGD